MRALARDGGHWLGEPRWIQLGTKHYNQLCSLIFYFHVHLVWLPHLLMTKKDCWEHKNSYKGQRHQNLEHSHRTQICGTFWVQDLTHSFNFFLYNRSNTTNNPYNRKDNKVLQFAVYPLLPEGVLLDPNKQPWCPVSSFSHEYHIHIEL